MNELQSLSQLFQNKIFRIPDYEVYPMSRTILNFRG